MRIAHNNIGEKREPTSLPSPPHVSVFFHVSIKTRNCLNTHHFKICAALCPITGSSISPVCAAGGAANTIGYRPWVQIRSKAPAGSASAFCGWTGESETYEE